MRDNDDDDDDDTKSHGSTRRNSSNGKCKGNRWEIIKSAILLPKSLRDLDYATEYNFPRSYKFEDYTITLQQTS